MIGVCIPAHDEEEWIGACLASVRRAAAQVHAEPVCIVVVADDCSDATEAVARSHRCDLLKVQARCVGAARAAGAQHLLARGARWLCCTDADSVVPSDWITRQLLCGGDVFCGTIGVADWREQPAHVAAAFARHYQDRDGHRHIHGANLGVCAHAYRRSGGFPSVPAHEDVQLVRTLEARGARIAWMRDPRVLTSARSVARAPHGFAHWLRERRMQLG
ncbi:glycosyltransferase [Xylophilus sp. ASV27]|uniref:glycosyltransferase n=1 Tax=Xylophilus sp. ASV27 TaxID=2795129 RepID=UPI0018ECE22C|nr:glycosyltransferase [Xylophilus sp. ASV27]